MDVGAILDTLVGLVPVLKTVLVVLGSLVVVATVLVKITPSQEDDALLVKLKAVPILGALLTALEKFSVLSRKE